MFSITKPLCVAAMAALIAPAFAAEWTTDLEAARKQAAAEGKAVLVEFTGSDWCGPCMHLKKMVLSTPAFEAYAGDKFVLVELDFPQNPKFPAELRNRNNEIAELYGIHAFPTILVLTPEGTVAGGMRGGVSALEQVTQPLDAALANIPALKEAEALEGEAKLKALHAIYLSMPKDLAKTLADRIAELDTDDTTGIRHALEVERQRDSFRDAFSAAVREGRSMEEKLALVDAALTDAHPENLPSLLFLKVEIQMELAKDAADIAAVKATVQQLMEADPAHAADLQRFIDEKLGDPDKLLEEIEASRKGRD